jgi:proline iminopeptidase
MLANREGAPESGEKTQADVLGPGEHSAMIDGLEQRYHVAGQGPVCLAHSGGPGVGWEYMRMPEAERHMTLIYIEPIGTGTSGRLEDPRGYTLDRYARYVDGLIAHLGLERAFLLGHSHGGFVAQRYALQHPERVSGLILYDTSPTTAEDFSADMGENLNRFAERHADEPWLADTMAAWAEVSAAYSDPDATDEQLTSIFRRMFPVYLADYAGRGHEFASMLEQLRVSIEPGRGEEPEPFDVRGELASITVPTLILVGRHDPICSLRWSRLLHEGISGAELAIFEGSGHFPHLEEPEAFTRALRLWIEESSFGQG